MIKKNPNKPTIKNHCILSWGYAVSRSVGVQGRQMMGFETSVSSPTMDLFVVNQNGGTITAKNYA